MLTGGSFFALLLFQRLLELTKALFIHVFSVGFGGSQILTEQQKGDRKVNKGKCYLVIPLHTPSEVTQAR